MQKIVHLVVNVRHRNESTRKLVGRVCRTNPGPVREAMLRLIEQRSDLAGNFLELCEEETLRDGTPVPAEIRDWAAHYVVSIHFGQSGRTHYSDYNARVKHLKTVWSLVPSLRQRISNLMHRLHPDDQQELLEHARETRRAEEKIQAA